MLSACGFGCHCGRLGLGGWIGTPGCWSFLIWYVHFSSSSAILSHSLSSPSLFIAVLFVISPVVLLVDVCVSSMMSSGRRRWRLLTIAFLFVMMTPEGGLGLLLEKAVSILCLGGHWFGLLTTTSLPMYIIDRIATRFCCASGKLKNIFLILVFLMCSSLTCVIFIRRMLLIFWWMKEMSFRKWCSLIAQFSHPQRRILMMYWMKTDQVYDVVSWSGKCSSEHCSNKYLSVWVKIWTFHVAGCRMMFHTSKH